jgi:hypothetical protein
MIPQQTMMNDALSPHTPSPLPAHANATVTGTAIVYLADLQPQPVEVGAWWWILPHPDGEYPRSTRQDAQMNYLSTLSIFMKQTTYLATLPNPKI